MSVSDDELKALAEKAGLGSRSTAKLIKANQQSKEPDAPKSPRGHGSTVRPPTEIGDF